MTNLIPFSLEGNIAAIFGRILDVYWLSEGEHDKIRDPLLIDLSQSSQGRREKPRLIALI
jgi:hypothetical protein